MLELVTLKSGPPSVLTHMAAVESHSSTDSTYLPPDKGAVWLLAVPEVLHKVADGLVVVPELEDVVVVGVVPELEGAAVVVVVVVMVVVAGAMVVVEVVVGAMVVVGVEEEEEVPQG